MFGPGGRGSPRIRNVIDRIPFLDKELFLLADFVPPGGVFVDVGAAGGAQTLLASRLVGPTGHVVAIEARPGSARVLRGWRNLLRRDNVTVLATALGSAPGSFELRVPLIPTRTHTADDRRDDSTLLSRLPARTRAVGVTTLDLVVASQGLERVDFVKVDVEGGEMEVLRGAVATIDQHRPVLLLEVFEPFLQPETSAPELFAWLTVRGYRAHVFSDDGLEPVETTVPGEYNYLFVPIA